MKNIHILQTEKPSRLVLETKNSNLFITSTYFKDDLMKHQHIYITSDEEIKDGDSIFETDINTINIAGKDYVENEVDFKIILTTDQDLIKDGVQAIDDKFLEWFVKNPSCEEVEVNFIEDNWGYYEIIIPKEEPKQETLEEAAVIYAHKSFIWPLNKQGEKQSIPPGQLVPTGYAKHQKIATKHFTNGAKWQQERSYSEEDIKQAFEDGKENIDYSDTYGWSSKLTKEEWFEIFKNK